MLESGPYSPLVYWPHVAFGIVSALLVLVAILAAKGSRLHRRSGQLFAAAMGIAAVTAILFSLVRFAPMALFSSVNVIYGLGAGILALRARNPAWRAVEYLLALVPLCLVLFVIVMTAMTALTAPEPLPPPFYLFSALVAGIFAYFFWTDVRFLRGTGVTPFSRFRRHALRMALAASETVRAPLISFGPPLLGDFTVPVYFLGPFLLIPAIYLLAMPDWVKRGEARAMRAGQSEGALAQPI